MECFGKYNSHDRICDLCITTNQNEAKECIKETQITADVKRLVCKCEYRESYCDKDHDWSYYCIKMDNVCKCSNF